jgi:hypothetical protein
VVQPWLKFVIYNAALLSREPAEPPASRDTTRTAGRAHGDARPTRRAASSRATPASTARPWPSAEKPTVRTDRPDGTDAVRYTSVDTATHRPTVSHRDTRRDKNKTAPGARFRSQGPFPLVVAGVGFEPT